MDSSDKRSDKHSELTLGEKIKEARIAQQLTQSELVGDFITRNMLSKIENDAAAPSLKTLEYLAYKLNMPLSYFMSSMVSNPEDLDPSEIDLESTPFRRLAAELTSRDMRARSPLEQEAVCTSFAEAILQPLPLFTVCRHLAEYHLAAEDPAARQKALPYINLLQAQCAFLSSPTAESFYWEGASRMASGDNAAAMESFRRCLDLLREAGEDEPGNAMSNAALSGQVYRFLEACSVAVGDYKAAYEYAQHSKK